MFVTFEGIDGSGKSTQAALLAEWLREQGHEVLATREPGGTPLGEAVRDLVLHGHEMTPWAEAALFAAARAEHVERAIRPALERGARTSVCDRYVDSSVAYQGIARGLGEDEVLQLNLTVTGGLLPDRTFLVLLDAEEAQRRGRGRSPTGSSARTRASCAASTRRTARSPRGTPSASSPSTAHGSPEEIAEEVREHVRALL